MKAEYLKIEKPFSQTINIRKDIRNYFFDKWHYHSVLELVYIQKGEGEDSLVIIFPVLKVETWFC